MGKGKSKRRRQANYEAAHSHSGLHLAPAPCKKDGDPVPRKVRQIMKLMQPDAAGLAKPQRGPQRAESQQRESVKSIGKTEKATTGEVKTRSKRDRLDLESLEGASLPKPGIRQRQKSYLDKKKKKKNKRGCEDGATDSFKRVFEPDEVPFGEVVHAPPKLPPLKRVPAKEELIRQQAVEAYRRKRSWGLRPGSNLSAAAQEG